MDVADEPAEIAERVGGLLAFHTGMVGVPEEGDVVRLSACEDRCDVFGAAELAVGLDNHGHARRSGVFAELVETFGDACDRNFLLLARQEPIGEDTNIRRLHGVSEIDEAPCFVEVSGASGRIGFVHLGRRTQDADPEVHRRKILQSAFEASAAELGAFGQVHLIENAAQFKRGKPPRRCVPDYGVPIPPGAAQGGDGKREAGGRTGETGSGASRTRGGQAQELTAVHAQILTDRRERQAAPRSGGGRRETKTTVLDSGSF